MKWSNIALLILVIIGAWFFVAVFRDQVKQLGLTPEESLPPTPSELPLIRKDDSQTVTSTPQTSLPPAKKIMITDGIKHSIPLDQIVSGGVPKDGIPSIDNPRFVSIKEAQRFLVDGDFGIGLEYRGEARFYPFKILVWHEIVNDWVAGEPLAITYCPLCLTGIVFKREVNGQPVEFGVSGKLFNNNLLMYNRSKDPKNESLWLQAVGRAVVGPDTGKELEIIPSDNIAFGDWQKAHPEGKVLSQQTGFNRNYDRDPYGNYYTTPGTLFPLTHQDSRLPDKEVVLGVEVNGKFKAYPEKELKKVVLVNDEVGGEPIVIWKNPENQVSRALSRRLDDQVLQFELRDNQPVEVTTNTRWSWEGVGVKGKLKGKRLTEPRQIISFWFSWAANHPDTELFEVDKQSTVTNSGGRSS